MLLMPIACFLLPTTIPMYCWGESFKNAWFVCAMFRYAFVLNITWLVNSAAHKWGDKPYDALVFLIIFNCLTVVYSLFIYFFL